MTMHQSVRAGGIVRRAAVGLAAAATLTLTACGTGTTSSTAGTTTTSPTSDPSSAAASMAASATPTTSAAMSAGTINSTHNAADVMFAQQMIVHHQGAIEMADLAPTRAGSPQVKDLAATIKAAQTPEIEQMTGWLQAWGSGTDMNGMPNSTSGSPSAAGGMGGTNNGDGSSSAEMTTTGAMSAASTQMPGMMTGDQMAELTAATGTDFDRLFLQLMITHHQGAVQMADTELAQGANPDAQALAQSIKTSQTAQITTMQQLLQTR
jgi:uncharacterized protein (DUF305 family)